jgi:cytochrome P450
MTVTEQEPLLYDPFSWEIQHNPYPTYERLREEAPVYYNETHGFWALSRHADVLAASLAPLTFVSSHGVTLEGVEQGQPLLILKGPASSPTSARWRASCSTGCGAVTAST